MLRSSLLALIGAALLAGCGDSPRRAASTETAAPDVNAAYVAPAARQGRKLTVVRSQFGRILADGRGQAVYVFGKETSRRSECYRQCARAWPPVLTKGVPVAGRGVRARLLGTTRRRDGRRQVTYRGRPLYYYVSDSPGRVLCHDVLEFGGVWRVVAPDGSPVR